MNKSAEAFRTIGEVADELGVPKHVLRFWEGKFAQIRPMKRGGGRRYYRPEDMELLRGIRTLLHSSGYTIKGVQKILRDQGVERVKHAAKLAAASASPATDAAPTQKKSRRRGKYEIGATPPVEPGKATAVAMPVVAEVLAARPQASVVLAAIRDLEIARAILVGAPLPHRDPSSGDAGQERAGPP